jgi:hypothetical protein
MVEPIFLDFLERRGNEAYAAGFDRFDDWQFHFKSRIDRVRADQLAADHGDASPSSAIYDQAWSSPTINEPQK